MTFIEYSKTVAETKSRTIYLETHDSECLLLETQQLTLASPQQDTYLTAWLSGYICIILKK